MRASFAIVGTCNGYSPGRVCVPIETGKKMEKVESFDPFSVPTIKQICDEFISVKDEASSLGEMYILLQESIKIFTLVVFLGR